jgi:hypothetical protein
VIYWFHKVCSFKFNLYRYTETAADDVGVRLAIMQRLLGLRCTESLVADANAALDADLEVRDKSDYVSTTITVVQLVSRLGAIAPVCPSLLVHFYSRIIPQMPPKYSKCHFRCRYNPPVPTWRRWWATTSSRSTLRRRFTAARACCCRAWTMRRCLTPSSAGSIRRTLGRCCSPCGTCDRPKRGCVQLLNSGPPIVLESAPGFNP